MMEIKINLERDSDNTTPWPATITNVSGDLIQIDLINPDRTIQLNAEDLLKILSILF